MKLNVFRFISLGLVLSLCIGCSSSIEGDWYLEYMNLDLIHDSYKGEGQNIAIIDSGLIGTYQNEYDDKIIFEYNLIDDNVMVNDLNGHGSEMAILINKVAPESNLIILKIVNENGQTDADLLLEALKLAQEKGADIVNISLGSYKYNEAIDLQVQNMIANNITIVASIGDDGNRDFTYSASYNGVISVRPIDYKDIDYENSNTSSMNSYPFPGVDLQIIDENVSGSSYACALASGYIALLRENYEDYNISYDNDYIKEMLNQLNDHLDYFDLFKSTS